MKIPFDIKFRPQIESGEYKLETECGHPVSIMDWEWIDRNENKCLAVKVLMDEGYNIGYLFDYDGKRHSIFHSDSDSDLFIVTPEEELTDFEDGLRQVCEEAVKEAAVSPYRTSEDFAKRHSAKLLSLAIDARAKEMDEALEKSKLDKDSIPYHLIEFMCNLYTCRNWKEIEETAELYVTRIKAAAMKDLPRWKKSGIAFINSQSFVGRRNEDELFHRDRVIALSELEKLPGFKEDSHD